MGLVKLFLFCKFFEEVGNVKKVVFNDEGGGVSQKMIFNDEGGSMGSRPPLKKDDISYEQTLFVDNVMVYGFW